MTPTAPYEYKETLLKVENVSLTLGGNLILRDVNLEVKNLVRPGATQGRAVATGSATRRPTAGTPPGPA